MAHLGPVLEGGLRAGPVHVHTVSVAHVHVNVHGERSVVRRQLLFRMQHHERTRVVVPDLTTDTHPTLVNPENFPTE